MFRLAHQLKLLAVSRVPCYTCPLVLGIRRSTTNIPAVAHNQDIFSLLLASKDREIAKADQVIAKSDQALLAKDQALFAKDQVIAMQVLQLLEVKEALVLNQSQLHAVSCMRPLIEVGVMAYYLTQTPRNTNVSVTEACQSFVEKELLVPGHKKLTPEARGFLVQLEGNDSGEKKVITEAKNLWHELSKSFHNIPIVNETGFFCGGLFPLRTACAIIILRLQSMNLLTQFGPIKYATQ